MCINSEMKKILVTGGAGYIGSHFCKLLAGSGYMPVIVDNLSRGNLRHVRFGPFYNCDVRDADSITEILLRERPDVVAHFAGYAYVNESVQNPDMYLNNNIFGTAQLIKACAAAKIARVLFSSSCAVYGDSSDPIHEDSILRPINPYGYSKLIGENMFREFVGNKEVGSGDCGESEGGLMTSEKDLAPKEERKVIALRYFNAAGADSEGQLGAIHDPETRIIPLTIRAALDPNYTLSVFGDSHPTKDGTCVRDFVYIEDLCRAHMLALKYLLKEQDPGTGSFQVFNVGTGKGISILDLITCVEKVAGKKVKYKIVSAGKWESPMLVADANKIQKVLGFSAKDSKITHIVKTAYDWYEKQQSIDA